MNWRRVLLHRFVFVPLALAILVGGWNLYIVYNDDGIIQGVVRDGSGAALAGATVIFFERNSAYFEERKRTITDAKGAYRFTDMQIHIGQLEARTADGRQSQRRLLRLWFRAQNIDVAPLIVR
ncbi:MAG: carboxypeptidase regulatory-like domain-containing protein [Alphaproteobacteria bacterium]|nr:carboxypeptidase regulatory-like domain-containing protein [Alphaproteobacteria bacterium]